MDRVFDKLIDLQRERPTWNWGAFAAASAIRLAGNLVTGAAIGIGISVGRALAA